MAGSFRYLRKKADGLIPPIQLEGTLLSTSSMRLAWSVPKQKTAIESFIIEQQPNNITHTSTVPYIDVSGLSTDTPYTFKVRGVNVINRLSQYSLPFVQVIAGDVADLPTQLLVDEVPEGTEPTITDATTQLLRWVKPVSFNPVNYEIKNLTTGYTYPLVSGATLSKSLTGLTAGSTYQFTVAAINGSGTRFTSAPVYIKAVSKPSTPSSISYSVVADTLVRFNIGAVALDGMGGSSTDLVYEISVYSNYSTYKAYTKQVVRPNGDAFSVDLMGYPKGKNLNFKVRVTNSAGKVSSYRYNTSYVYIWDVPATPNLSAYDKSLAGDTLGTIDLKWSISKPTNNAPIQGYKVWAENPPLPQGDVYVGGSALSVRLTGMAKDSNSTYYVQAYNTVGYGIAAGRTKIAASVPPAPDLSNSVLPVRNADGSMTVPLDDVYPDDGGSDLTYVYVKAVSDIGVLDDSVFKAYPYASGSSLNLDNMTLGQPRYIEVYLRNALGIGPSSRFDGVYTTATKPSTPGIPTVTPLSETEASVTWTASNANGGTISNYNLELRTPQNVVLSSIDVGTATSYTLTSLSSNTTYHMSVRCTNEMGTSTESGARSFTTMGDSIPDAFGFTTVGDKTINTAITSNTITLTGMNKSGTFTCSNCTASINGGGFVASGAVPMNATVALKLTTTGAYQTWHYASIDIGGTVGTFAVGTMVQPVMTYLDTFSTGGAAYGVITGDTLTGISNSDSQAYGSMLEIPKDGNWWYYEFEGSTGGYIGYTMMSNAGGIIDSSVGSAKGVIFRWYNNRFYRLLVNHSGSMVSSATALSTTYVRCFAGVMVTNPGATARILPEAGQHTFAPNPSAFNAGATYQAPCYTLR